MYIFAVFQAELLEYAFFHQLAFLVIAQVAANGIGEEKCWRGRIDHITAL